MNSNYPLAAAMINQLNRVDMLSNNLANANTNGYKQTSMTEGTFNNYLTKAHKHSPLISKLNTINNNVPKLIQNLPMRSWVLLFKQAMVWTLH